MGRVRGVCLECGREMSLAAKGKCDKCYRTEYYLAHPEAKEARDKNQRERSARMYEERGEEMRARMRDYYWKTKGVKERKPQTRRKVLTVSRKDAEKAREKVYNESSKLCALCSRKVGRGEVMLWGEDLEVVHTVCGWAAEARARIERRDHATVRSEDNQEPMRDMQLGTAVRSEEAGSV